MNRAENRTAAFGLVLPILFVLGTSSPAAAKTFLYEGQMTSEVRLVITEKYSPDRAGAGFVLKAGRFPGFSYPVNRQEVRDFRRTYEPTPDKVEEKKDKWGNFYDEATWRKASGTLLCRTEFTAILRTDFSALASTAPWPASPASLPEEAKPYLADSEMLDQKQARVRDLAAKLTAGSRNQHDAVIRVMNWVVDNVDYLVNPDQYSAAFSLDTGRGNCQNYAHLACALLHSQGVAARVVNGLSLNRPWRVPMDNGTITLDGALGRHAWVEVFYPDLGWVNFDPQMSHYFVSTHLVKQAVGVDSPEISDYFLISGAKAQRVEKIDPTFGVEANGFRLAQSFPSPSNLIITGMVRSAAGAPVQPPPAETPAATPARPRPLLVTDGKPGSKDRIEDTLGPKARPPPPVEPERPARAAPTPGPLRTPPAATPPPASPAPTARVGGTPAPIVGPATPSPSPLALLTPLPATPAPLPFQTPAPAATATPSPAGPPRTPSAADIAALTRLAEIGLIDISEDAAQYVTNGEEFAQRFEIREPMILWEAELALYKFGDSEGSLRVEVHDDENGVPAPTARMKSVERPIPGIRFRANYQWVGFNFRNLGAGAYLPPGRYWLVLGYTPDAIFNWHCRIGNPYLDPDDTRSRKAGEGRWDNILNVDFNFLLTGIY